MEIKFKKLHENAIIPVYAHEKDAGLDFYSLEDYTSKKKHLKIRTGVAWEPSDDNKFALIIKDKSSKCFDYKIVGGVIDHTYRGEIIICIEKKKSKLTIKKGQKVAQGIIYILPEVKIIEAQNINITNRGAGGFGSSGE